MPQPHPPRPTTPRARGETGVEVRPGSPPGLGGSGTGVFLEALHGREQVPPDPSLVLGRRLGAAGWGSGGPGSGWRHC